MFLLVRECPDPLEPEGLMASHSLDEDRVRRQIQKRAPDVQAVSAEGRAFPWALADCGFGSRVSFNITRRGEFACRAGRKGKSSTWTFLPCHPVERKKSEREKERLCVRERVSMCARWGD